MLIQFIIITAPWWGLGLLLPTQQTHQLLLSHQKEDLALRLYFRQSLGWGLPLRQHVPCLCSHVMLMGGSLLLLPLMDVLKLCVPRKVYRQVYGPSVSFQHPDPQRAHVRRMKGSSTAYQR